MKKRKIIIAVLILFFTAICLLLAFVKYPKNDYKDVGKLYDNNETKEKEYEASIKNNGSNNVSRIESKYNYKEIKEYDDIDIIGNEHSSITAKKKENKEIIKEDKPKKKNNKEEQNIVDTDDNCKSNDIDNESKIKEQKQEDEETVGQDTSITEALTAENIDSEIATTERITTQEQISEKVWHEPIYEDVWVIDEEAWTEDIYEQHSVCNQCGMDITADGIRAPQHIKETECYSYRSEMVKVNTIYHEPKGHYEKKIVSDGYWE